jgi:hypothetical protein
MVSRRRRPEQGRRMNTDPTFVIPAQAGIQSPKTTKSRRTRRRAQGEGNRR